ncbi:serine protease [Pseudomonas sp. AA-38]|uniref:S1 family peptidase n=1 Tax=Pseudomonas sp. AA-38 TaxID=3028807 RepID=UPI0023F69EF7|nr:serine protease [Pseudomonas sp. AA-38]
MITTNAIQRTFHIKIGDSTGTCFTIDVKNKQYIVTARHVASGLTEGSSIEIFHQNAWKNMPVTVVGHCAGEVDVSVLAANQQISPVYVLEPTSAGMMYGQDVYFLGFPYGMAADVGPMNRDFPIPFVKKGIVSCMLFEEGVQIYYLDGINNPGFSGGPVIFKKSNVGDYKVCSIISGYRYAEEPVYQNGYPVPLELRANTGIVITYGIKHAVDLIEANPIGYELPV